MTSSSLLKLALATGLMTAISLTAFAQTVAPLNPKPLAFEVATIKPTARTDGSWRLQPTPNGYTGTDVSLLKLIGEAYGIFDPKLLSGGPPWIDRDKFDLEAKFDPTTVTDAKNLTYRQRADMLQALLADRFHLKVHHESKEFPIYNLVIAKGGSKLQQTKPENVHQFVGGQSCLFRRSQGGYIQVEGCMPKDLEDQLRYITGRTVIDKTGLTARYDFELRWTSENTTANSLNDTGPSIFTAVEEQLGLKLKPATAPLDILVIDSAEHPSEN